MKKKNVDGRSTIGHDIKKFRTRSIEKEKVDGRSTNTHVSRNLDPEKWRNRK
jgi:hypothetical protein